jgi:hypothetical protein
LGEDGRELENQEREERGCRGVLTDGEERRRRPDLKLQRWR